MQEMLELYVADELAESERAAEGVRDVRGRRGSRQGDGDGAVVVRAGGAREEDVVSAGTTRAREVRGEGPRREIVPRASAPGGGEVRGVRCENGARGGDPRLVSEKRLVGGEAEEGDASGRRGAGRPPGNARCDDGRESNARARTPARCSSRAP